MRDGRLPFDLLTKHRADMEKLVDALMQNEEMDREDVEKLLSLPPAPAKSDKRRHAPLVIAPA